MLNLTLARRKKELTMLGFRKKSKQELFLKENGVPYTIDVNDFIHVENLSLDLSKYGG